MTSDWISIKERLPEDGQMVATYDQFGYGLSRFSEGGFEYARYFTRPKIAWWYPLPEPPKEEAD